MEIKHTPLPYEIDHTRLFPVVLGKHGKDLVCRPYGETGSETDENCKFIVRACNNHYKMVEALKDILHYQGGANSPLEDEYVMDRAVTALAEAEAE